MKTHITKQADIEKKWFLIDAKGETLGRLATTVADLLRGKNKVNFSPSVDCGDNVIVINTDLIAVTGKKLTDKHYYNYSGFPGGMRDLTLEEVMGKDSRKVIHGAVKGMLPKNRLADEMLGKLKLYKDENHNHSAQKPAQIKVKG